jgi:hypothetical protein
MGQAFGVTPVTRIHLSDSHGIRQGRIAARRSRILQYCKTQWLFAKCSGPAFENCICPK